MEEFFKKKPLSIAFLIAGFLLGDWIFSSFWIGLLGAVVGAVVGNRIDGTKL